MADQGDHGAIAREAAAHIQDSYARARKQLGDSMRQDVADRASAADAFTAKERDIMDATRQSYQSGDYDAKGNYNPFTPKRGK